MGGGPGTGRLGARQQQGPSGSDCASAWMHVTVGSTLCLLQSIMSSLTHRQGAMWLCMIRFRRRSTTQDRAWSQHLVLYV